MSAGGGRWESWAARAYYLLGVLYYSYKWLALGGAFGLAASAVAIAKPFFGASALAAASLGCLLVAGVYWMRAARRRLQGANPGLQLVSVETSYAVRAGGEYIHGRTIHAVATRDGVDHYKHKFGWTGQGEMRAELAHHGSGTIGVEPNPLSPGWICRVNFERPLRKGQQITIAFLLRLRDEAASAKPYLSIVVNDWITSAMTMKVRFEGHAIPARVMKEILLSRVSELPMFYVEEPPRHDGDAGEMSWHIRRPRPGHCYRLSW